MNIGIIGTGNISNFLIKKINNQNSSSNLNVISVFGRNKDTGQEIEKNFNVIFFDEIENFLSSPIDVVVEAASVEAAKTYTPAILKAGKDIVISSVGAFADQEFFKNIEQIASKNGKKVYIPSGAIGGVDVLKAANVLGELKEVSITTKKSPKSLGLNEFAQNSQIIFEGSAFCAIGKFPKNINVSIILSLAGIGALNTKVKIIADPNVSKNTHIINAVGEFGKMNVEIENEPMPNNPKTSYLAALSILSILNDKEKNILIGS